MNANNGMSRFLFRTKTVTTDQAAVLLPIFGEWKGTGTGHLLMSSRNGQIMSFSARYRIEQELRGCSSVRFG
ncbi:MAG: hypothetical protein ACLSE8_04285 [Parasutterella sp.]